MDASLASAQSRSADDSLKQMSSTQKWALHTMGSSSSPSGGAGCSTALQPGVQMASGLAPSTDFLGATGRYPLLGSSSTALHMSRLERQLDRDAALRDLMNSTLPGGGRDQYFVTEMSATAAAAQAEAEEHAAAQTARAHADAVRKVRLAPAPGPGAKATHYRPEHDRALLHFAAAEMPMSPPTRQASSQQHTHYGGPVAGGPLAGEALQRYTQAGATSPQDDAADVFGSPSTAAHRLWLADLHATLVPAEHGKPGADASPAQRKRAAAGPAAAAVAALPAASLPPLPMAPQSMAGHAEFQADYMASKSRQQVQAQVQAAGREWLSDLAAAPVGGEHTSADGTAGATGQMEDEEGARRGHRRVLSITDSRRRVKLGTSTPAHAMGNSDVYASHVEDSAVLSAAQARVAILWDTPDGEPDSFDEDDVSGLDRSPDPATGHPVLRLGHVHSSRRVVVTPHLQTCTSRLQAAVRGHQVRALVGDDVQAVTSGVRQAYREQRAATTLAAAWHGYTSRRATSAVRRQRDDHHAASQASKVHSREVALLEARARRERLAQEAEAARAQERAKEEEQHLQQSSQRIERHHQYARKALQRLSTTPGAAGGPVHRPRTESQLSIDFDALEAFREDTGDSAGADRTHKRRSRVQSQDLFDALGLPVDSSAPSSTEGDSQQVQDATGTIADDGSVVSYGVSQSDLSYPSSPMPRDLSTGSLDAAGVGGADLGSAILSAKKQPPPAPPRRGEKRVSIAEDFTAGTLGDESPVTPPTAPSSTVVVTPGADSALEDAMQEAAAQTLQASMRAMLAEKEALRQRALAETQAAADAAAATADAEKAVVGERRRAATVARQKQHNRRYEERVLAKRVTAVINIQRCMRGWMARREVQALRHLAWRAKMRQPTPANLTRLFVWVDADEDGDLSVSEFTRAGRGKRTIGSRDMAHLHGLEPLPQPPGGAAAFQRHNVGRRGVNLIELDEATNVKRENKAYGPALGMTSMEQMRLFQYADANGDGVLSQEEFLGAFTGTHDSLFLDWMQQVLIKLAEAEANPSAMSPEELAAIKSQAAQQAMQLRARQRRRKLRLATLWRMMAGEKTHVAPHEFQRFLSKGPSHNRLTSDLKAQLALFQMLDHSQNSVLEYAAFISGLTDIKDAQFEDWMDSVFQSAAIGSGIKPHVESKAAASGPVGAAPSHHQMDTQAGSTAADNVAVRSAWNDVLTSVQLRRKQLRSVKKSSSMLPGQAAEIASAVKASKVHATPEQARVAPARVFKRQNSEQDLKAVMSPSLSAAAIADAMMQPGPVSPGAPMATSMDASGVSKVQPGMQSTELATESGVVAVHSSSVVPVAASVVSGGRSSAIGADHSRVNRLESVSNHRIAPLSRNTDSAAQPLLAGVDGSPRAPPGGASAGHAGEHDGDSDSDSTATLHTPPPLDDIQEEEEGVQSPPPCLGAAYDDASDSHSSAGDSREEEEEEPQPRAAAMVPSPRASRPKAVMFAAELEAAVEAPGVSGTRTGKPVPSPPPAAAVVPPPAAARESVTQAQLGSQQGTPATGMSSKPESTPVAAAPAAPTQAEPAHETPVPATHTARPTVTTKAPAGAAKAASAASSPRAATPPPKVSAPPKAEKDATCRTPPAAAKKVPPKAPPRITPAAAADAASEAAASQALKKQQAAYARSGSVVQRPDAQAAAVSKPAAAAAAAVATATRTKGGSRKARGSVLRTKSLLARAASTKQDNNETAKLKQVRGSVTTATSVLFGVGTGAASAASVHSEDREHPSELQGYSDVRVSRNRGAPIRGSLGANARSKIKRNSMINVKRASFQSVGEKVFRSTRTRGMSVASEQKLRQVRGSTTSVQLVLGAVAESVGTESLAGGDGTPSGGDSPAAKPKRGSMWF